MNKLPTLCEQHENEKKLLYFENDYDVVDVDGHLWVYVPETYKSYPEYDYQVWDSRQQFSYTKYMTVGTKF